MRTGLCLLLLTLFSLAACQSTQPTPTPSPSALYDHTPEFSGLYLNIDPTPFGGHMFYTVVRSLQDVPHDNIVMLDRQANWVIFTCNTNYHTGTRVGSVTTPRLCGMRLDGSDQRLLAVNAYNAIVSPDHHWVLFGGKINEQLCCDCKMNLYAMHVDGSNLMNLTDGPQFANMRRCSIGNLAWEEIDDKVWIHFKAWTGKSGDFPEYLLLFRPEV